MRCGSRWSCWYYLVPRLVCSRFLKLLLKSCCRYKSFFFYKSISQPVDNGWYVYITKQGSWKLTKHWKTKAVNCKATVVILSDGERSIRISHAWTSTHPAFALHCIIWKRARQTNKSVIGTIHEKNLAKCTLGLPTTAASQAHNYRRYFTYACCLMTLHTLGSFKHMEDEWLDVIFDHYSSNSI